MRGVDEGEPALLAGLGHGVVAQVGGEEHVHAGGPDLVEEAVARAAADGDGTDQQVGVAGDADALGGRGSRAAARAANARRVSGWSSSQIRPRPRRPSGSLGSGTSGPVIRRSRAPARASETPGSAVSALVWATCSAMSFLIIVCTTRPLKVPASTVVVPRR